MQIVLEHSSPLALQGAEYGQDLAAALVLAVRRSAADYHAKRQMAEVVLREILDSIDRLRAAGVPNVSIGAYEWACRAACRDTLLSSLRGNVAAVQETT
jgi:hypothetical protein